MKPEIKPQRGLPQEQTKCFEQKRRIEEYFGECDPYSTDEAEAAELLGRKNYRGFGVGIKISEGKLRPEVGPVLLALVVRKASPGIIEDGFLFSDLAKKALGEDVKTDVIQSRPTQVKAF